MADNIAVLGGGAWGSALASMLVRKGLDTVLWARDEATCREINTHHRNGQYLDDIVLPKQLMAVSDVASALDGANIILVATPAQTTGEVAALIAPMVRSGTAIIACSKGIDRDTLKTPCEVIEANIGGAVIATLSGPSFAIDVARGLPTAVTLAANDLLNARNLADRLAGQGFRIYASDDRKGVELGGALKNIIAIAVGICRGMGLGASAEAALATRGFAEISRLAIKLGARTETLMGLSGLGDLMLTCSSEKSRNFTYGMVLGRGGALEGLKLAEGAKSVFMADELARRLAVDCPVIAATRAVVAGKILPSEAVSNLLQRPLKAE